MLKRTIIGLFLFTFCLSITSAYAFEASSWTKEATKSDKSRAKMEFGMTNFFLGWTELLTEPYQGYKSGEDTGLVTGFFDGIFNSIFDTAGGLVHLASFPCSNLDVPLPEGGTDIWSIAR